MHMKGLGDSSNLASGEFAVKGGNMFVVFAVCFLPKCIQ